MRYTHDRWFVALGHVNAVPDNYVGEADAAQALQQPLRDGRYHILTHADALLAPQPASARP